ncbi:sarcosine oxidase subunit gamma [Mycolicibacterium moriokaense]|nr:sarcosine oxidase subunit gamma [Mycolicibacterium moriokaense]
MADTLARTSPLRPWADRFAELSDSVTLVEEPFTTMVELRCDRAGAGAALAGLLDLALPTTPGTYTRAADAEAIWLGPDEWLITGTSLTGSELEARLRDALGPRGGTAVDVSGQRTTLRLTGPRSADVLAKGCAIDLHPGVFGGGAAAQTTLGHTGVILLSVRDDATDYRILVRSSFARYLADWLLDAAEEYTP